MSKISFGRHLIFPKSSVAFSLGLMGSGTGFTSISTIPVSRERGLQGEGHGGLGKYEMSPERNL
jgi:hypothetical protein